jgi:hypothetical protein
MDTDALILAAAQIASGWATKLDPKMVVSGTGSSAEEIAKAAVLIARAIAEEARD